MKQLSLLGVLTVALAIFVAWGGNFAPHESDALERTVLTFPAAAPKVAVTMLYSSEKREWIAWARTRYTHVNPEVEIKLTEMGSVESADAILKRKVAPVVWSPSNRAVLQLAATRWLTQTGTRPLFHDKGDAAPQSLARTLLVLLTWKDRAKVIRASSQARVLNDKPLELLLALAAAPNGWQALGGPPEWGRLKFDSPNPLRAAVGIDLLYLVALEHGDFPSHLDPAALDAPEIAQMFHTMAASRPELEASALTLVTDMLRYGPAQYDIIASYECLGLLSLHSNPELVIHYPSIAVWSDNPAVVLDLEETTPTEKAEGVRWINYLRLPEIQREAIRYGFRPVDPNISLLEDIGGYNPFTAPAAEGTHRDFPRVAPFPTGAVVEKLLAVWTTATGRKI